jgi:hypothetical protein
VKSDTPAQFVEGTRTTAVSNENSYKEQHVVKRQKTGCFPSVDFLRQVQSHEERANFDAGYKRRPTTFKVDEEGNSN